MVRRRFGNRELKWAEFQATFNRHFILDWVCEQKMYDFIELEQEVKKAAKFQRSLRAEIHHALAGARILDFSTIVQRDYVIGRDLNEAKGRQEAQKGVGSSQGPSRNKKRRWDAQSVKGVIGPPSCSIYGKRHGGVYQFGGGVCYVCGQQGHQRKDCPQHQGSVNVSRDANVTCFRCGQKGYRADNCP
ncbi:cold shock domain-containing protein 3-like [Diospyros lotus]|uniref:cold shock domain-containing protein 3-like n=1 Tax=Diospyros lotus TaxID=55363 RepID=UPI002256A6FD|nr:cold shock domain-containing protein 3-like [Diospyros lotus]